MSFGATFWMTALARCAGVERGHERARRVFALRQDPQALLRALAHLGRVRSEEDRRAGDQRAVDDRELQRDVVALDAPAPGAPCSDGVPKTEKK